MSVASESKEDRAIGITPPIMPSTPWRLVSVEAKPGYILSVRFRDGLAGLVHMKEMVESPAAGVFAALRDPDLFASVRVELGVATWPGEIDLAPDAMYDAISAYGEWTLR